MTDVKMYNVGAVGGVSGASSAGPCAPVLTFPGSIQILEALQHVAESIDAIATRPTSTPSINIEIPEIRIPPTVVNVPKFDVAPAPAAYVTVRFEVPKVFMLCLVGLPPLAVAAVYVALKYFAS